MGALVGLALAGTGSLVARADGGLTVAPSSGAPGTRYAVTVDCGEFPLLYRGFTQDGYVPGTIGPRGTDEVSEVSPSVWRYDATAGRTDDTYWATCGQSTLGTGYFDAEAPHLWFGPRPRYIGEERDPKTTVEGTDCPAGTTATVRILLDGDAILTREAPIDEHGDWSVALPGAVGTREMTVDASCGGVTYERLVATTTSTSIPATTPATSGTTAPPGTPPPATPATPQAGTAGYTG